MDASYLRVRLHKITNKDCIIYYNSVGPSLIIVFQMLRLLIHLSTYRPSNMGDLTSLTANRNCIAHTSKQHKFKERDRAHSANVTSYTIMKSSGELRVRASSRALGDILSRNIKDNNAKRRDTATKNKNIQT